MRYIILLQVLLYSCSAPKENGNENTVGSVQDSKNKIQISHATAFEIDYREGYKIITLESSISADGNIYVLKGKDTPMNPEIESLGQKIEIPASRVVCTSTSQIILMESLGLSDRLVGFPQTEYIYSNELRQRVQGGNITEVGVEALLNIETVMSIGPDFVMAFNIGPENRQLNKLREMGVPVVMTADFMESSPLGKAEWIKFMSVFFNKEDLANRVFQKIVEDYDSLKKSVQGLKKVDVFSGLLYGGTWYMPGGKNYNSNILADAGGNYLWKNDSSQGWLNISFESVYDKARSANVWIGVGGYTSLSEMESADSRYANFAAFRDKRVYSYVNRVSNKGANDYFESAVIRPDIVLADHIKMLHPDLMADYELFYFKRLK